MPVKIIVVSLAAAAVSAAVIPLAWRERAGMPLPRTGYVTGVVGGKLLVAGGTYWKDQKKLWSDRADFFDPARDTWEPAPPLPTPLADAASVTVNDTIYAFGGSSGEALTGDGWQFRTNTWIRFKTPLPAARQYIAGAVIGRAIYVVGGLTRFSDYASASSTVWRLELDRTGGGQWQELAPLPGPGRFTFAMAAAGGRLFVFGGVTSEEGKLRNLDDGYVFDPRSNAWLPLFDAPAPRRAWKAVAYGGRILLLGGYGDDFTSEVLEFDTASEEYRPCGRLPHPIADMPFTFVGGRLIGTGGESAHMVRGPWTFEGNIAK
jgi:N-acetylneuraminate epimerase